MYADHLLTLQPYHLGKRASHRRADAFLKRIGISKPKSRTSKAIAIDTSGGQQSFSYAAIVKEFRERGYPKQLGWLVDANDAYFGGGRLSVAVGKNMSIKVQHGTKNVELRGPARVAPIESELTEDILYYRRVACENSDDVGLVETTRAFRSYLFACVSLIEAFLNRYREIIGQREPSLIDELNPRGLSNGVEAWLRIVAGKQDTAISMFKQPKEWVEFKRMVSERNKRIHVGGYWYGDDIRELHRFLNYAKAGVGGLLAAMRKASGEPTLGFIERLRTAPRVEIHL
jgi:hypothetical protein